jgi:hypothetical protein
MRSTSSLSSHRGEEDLYTRFDPCSRDTMTAYDTYLILQLPVYSLNVPTPSTRFIIRLQRERPCPRSGSSRGFITVRNTDEGTCNHRDSCVQEESTLDRMHR